MTPNTSLAQDAQRFQGIANPVDASVGTPRETSAPPPIDTSILLGRCMGNISFAATLLNELEANGPQQVDALFRQVANDELYAAAEVAHSLKGAAAIVGAEPLRSKAAEVEAASEECDASRLLDAVNDLRREMDRCLAFIPTVRAATQQPLVICPANNG
ncbi:MAG: Hpt domain-containing protein [Pirellulales bacterium]